MKVPARPRVILRRCTSYDVERIRTIVREGLEQLELRPFGRTLVKPNVVCSGEMFPHAYTRPEFIEGVLRALIELDRKVEQRDGNRRQSTHRFDDRDTPVTHSAVPGRRHRLEQDRE